MAKILTLALAKKQGFNVFKSVGGREFKVFKFTTEAFDADGCIKLDVDADDVAYVIANGSYSLLKAGMVEA